MCKPTIEQLTARLEGKKLIPLFIILESSAASKYGRNDTRKNIAVIQTNGVDKPKRIANRDKAVVQIVKRWFNQHVGTTTKCAYSRALKEAMELTAQLNSDYESVIP